MQRTLARMASRYFISSGLHAEILTRLDIIVDGRATDTLWCCDIEVKFRTS